MSAKMRILWIYPAIVVASWLAVRSLGASPEQTAPADDPPAPLTELRAAPEVKDLSLARLIGRFAMAARTTPNPVR